MMSKIWERYFLYEIAKIFLLFIFGFYFLYVLIDYAAHTKLFSQQEIPLYEVAFYYLCHFSKRAEILISFALMLSTIKVLCSSNIRNELVSLLVGGVRLRELLRPFVFIASLCTLFLYLNFQFFSPAALYSLQLFKDRYFAEDVSINQKQYLYELPLSDNTTLLYQSYDMDRSAFFDVYWVHSADHIYRMKYLNPQTSPPESHYVDHLIRNTLGEFILVESFKKKTFAEMRFDEDLLRAALNPPDQRSISQLWEQISFYRDELTDKEAQILTNLVYKLFVPLVCFFVVLGVAPYCMVFTRHLRVFFIYSMALFSLLAFFTVLQAAVVLGENQVLYPVTVVLLPIGLFSALIGVKFSKSMS